MMYNKDDVIYILENNTTIRKGKIARKQGGELYHSADRLLRRTDTAGRSAI